MEADRNSFFHFVPLASITMASATPRLPMIPESSLRLFAFLADDQLVSVAMHHKEKFDRAWKICMTHHYRTGAYIDAEDNMDREREVLGQLIRYAYSNRSGSLYDRLVEAINW